MKSCASRSFALLLLFLVVSAGGMDSLARANDLSERIDRIFAAYDQPDFPGCAVIVLQQGRIIHQRGYGQAHLEWDAPITPSTIFPVASLSKQFTAMAVCLLAEQGKLSLDDDVRKYLPELPDYGAVITLRHLLQHTSGLRDVWYLGGLAGWRPNDLVTDRDVLNLSIRQKTLNFRPGTQHVYNSTGYTLAGIVVQRVSGQSLRAYADDQIFKPLGMNSTHFHNDHTEVVKNRASAYAMRSGRLTIAVPTYEALGTTGLFTTVKDLARWDQNFYDRRVGSKALDQMLTPGKLNYGEAIWYGHDLGYGFGLVIGRYRGLKIVCHSGWDWGYRSEFLQFPEQRFSVIILANLNTLEPYFLARQAADVCLAKEFPEPPKPGAQGPNATAEPIKLSESELATWAGTYWNLDTGACWKFSVNNGTLCIGAGRELVPLAPDRFRIGDEPIELTFTPATDAAPRKLTWLDVEPGTFEAVPELTLTRAQLKEYAGTYRSGELNAEFTLSIRNDELVVVGWRDDYGPLLPVTADGFALRPRSLPSAFIRFTRNGQHEVTGFTLSTTGCKNISFIKKSG